MAKSAAKVRRIGRGYADLRDHIEALERAGLLVRVSRLINKDTEMHPLVRWQYRGGLPEKDWRGFLFENVTGVKRKHYDIPVAVGVMAGSKYIVAVGLDCEADAVADKWQKAFRAPVEPMMVKNGPVHQVVLTGADVKRSGGLDQFPVPISTPGFDGAPFITAGHWITKDPDTGIRNVGNYRGHLKAKDRLGIFPGPGQHVLAHWQKCKAKGIPLQAAVVVGPPPVVSYAAVQKVPYGVDELAVAGGLVDEPIRLVKCKTVDIEVPADAEIVIEGILATDAVEPEGPFGESHGYMHPRMMNPFMQVTAITRKKNPILVSWTSQVTPSESSIIKRVGYEPLFLKHLKGELGIKSVVKVALHEPLTNLRKVIVVQMKNPTEAETWRALMGAATFHPAVGKFLVAVDEDIDPWDMDMVMWAISYRSMPDKDVQILKGRERGHGPPFSRDDEPVETRQADESAMLVNAILRDKFPPVSLPKKEYMENARKIWEELGLPRLSPKNPWYGYPLGDWDDDLEEEARLAVKGDYLINGEKLKGQRKKI
ncbi:MAG TPA: UbiD family decarboxylase [Candidatus Binatia bacterium]|nr:UbiD family decarboxylase [Candidatus Binatia bacterium]